MLRSTVVLGDVVDRDPALFDVADVAPDRRGEAGLKKLRDHLAIATEKGSNVIRLSYSDRSPTRAAEIMNRIVDSFLRQQLRLRTEPAQRDARWFDARTRDSRKRLETAQLRLSDFQRQHGILGTQRMDIEADKVRQMSTQLIDAQAAAAEARSRATSGSVPEVVNADVSQNVERDLSAQAGKVAELSKTLGPNHPEMLAARAQLAALRSALGAARSTRAQSLSAASSAASKREGSIRAELAAQQERMLALSGVQDQINVLQRDVDAARQNYDSVRQRLNEATLSSEVSQANATRLDRAAPPALPYKPNLMLYFAAALILGLTGGLLAGMIRELLAPRVRTASGAARALDLAVLADFTETEGGGTMWRSPAREEATA